MTPPVVVALLNLVSLPGAHGQTVYVNPSEVVSIRTPAPTAKDHYAPGIRCVIQTSDGKIVASTDNCGEVANRLRVDRDGRPCTMVCAGERP
jgi:hypothetical protein